MTWSIEKGHLKAIYKKKSRQFTFHKARPSNKAHDVGIRRKGVTKPSSGIDGGTNPRSEPSVEAVNKLGTRRRGPLKESISRLNMQGRGRNREL